MYSIIIIAVNLNTYFLVSLFVIQSEAKNLGNTKWMLPRFFTALRSVLNDMEGKVIFFCKIRNYLHYIHLCVKLFVYFCGDKKEIGY